MFISDLCAIVPGVAQYSKLKNAFVRFARTAKAPYITNLLYRAKTAKKPNGITRR